MAVVSARLRTGTAVELTARGLSWRGDEPPKAGGTDTGPTPFELVIGGLASCIAITLRLYASHKNIELGGVDVRIEFDRVHADDCHECDERLDGWIDRIRTQITIHGAFTETQRSRLARVAERCPVHKTLANGVQIFDDVRFAD